MIRVKDLEYYKALPYTISIKEVHDEDDHYYIGRYNEIYEARIEGDTLEELLKNLEEVFKLSIETRLSDGEDIPEPIDKEYSGTFNVRIPKSLHKKLAEEASAENTSLNQLVLYKLSI